MTVDDARDRRAPLETDDLGARTGQGTDVFIGPDGGNPAIVNCQGRHETVYPIHRCDLAAMQDQIGGQRGHPVSSAFANATDPNSVGHEGKSPAR
jgi:hypothetical protein